MNKKKKLATEEDSNSNIIIIESYDGAKHQETQKDKTNIVSFSSKLLLEDEL